MKTCKAWLKALLFLVILSLMTMSLPANAAGPWYVAPGGNDSNDCLSPGPSNACATIEGAFGKASAGDTVYVATGTYAADILLDQDITISGGWDVTFTTQSGVSILNGRFTLNTGLTATIEYFIIQNGLSGAGGGVRNHGSMTLAECTVSDSTAFTRGAGIFNDGDLTLTSCTVSGNAATNGDGGGIYNLNQLTVIDSTITNNTAEYYGAGIYNSGTMTLNDSTISNNSSRYGGGGIYNNTGTVTLNDSYVSANHGSGGGGIYNSDTVILNNSTVSGNTSSSGGGGIRNYGDLILNSSIISENTASGGGGGIENSGNLTLNNSSINSNNASGTYGGGGGISTSGTLNLNNSTISGNNVAGSYGWGGGIFIEGTTSLNSSTISDNSSQKGGGIYRKSGTVTIQNTIADDNASGDSPDCFGDIGSAGYNLIGNPAGCNYTPAAGDLSNLDAALGPLYGSPGYHPMAAGSPAINAGNPSGCLDHAGSLLDTDQRGAVRAGVCDIGAYEFTTPGSPTDISAIGGTPQSSPPNSPFGESLQALVLDVIGSPVAGVTVTFTAPASGPSGTFADSSTETTMAGTDGGGIATSAIFNANSQEGAYTVEASVSGVPTPANFYLTNSGWYVSSTGHDTINDCQTPSTPCASINGVLAKAEFTAGDIILVEQGTYIGLGTEVVLLDQSARLLGGWDATFTAQTGDSIIDGESSRRGITINSLVTAYIERFVVQNGSRQGGSTIGGGILNSGDLVLNDSAINDNSARDGGGGLYNGGTLIINDATVSGNSTTHWGGGISNDGIMTMNASAITGNTASGAEGDGGGIWNNYGTVSLNNSTVSGNTASDYGGGIASRGTLALHNMTISDNAVSEPTSKGGGIWVQEAVAVENTIIAGNIAIGGDSWRHPDCDGSITSLGYNLIGNSSGCTFTLSPGDLVDVEPQLGSFVGSPGYHPLLNSSPAINGANPAGCSGSEGPLTTDQRGYARLGRCDIGAYEAQSLKSISDDTAIPGESLSYEIAFQNPTETTKPYTVTDTLPSGITYLNGSLSATSGTPNYSAGVITWSDSVIPDQAVTITFDVKVGAVMGEIVNEVDINDGTENEMRSATVRIDAPVCTVTKYVSNPVLDLGTAGSWDDDGIWHPSVLLDGSTYKMWYAGNDDTYVNYIGLATSPDGYMWAREGSNPVLSPTETWEAGGVSRPSVILDGSIYKMWHTGVDSSGVIQIGYATSPDGISWTKHPGNPVLTVGTAGGWEDEDVTGPTVLKDGGTYHMWYGGNDGSTFRIGHATSSNGITWVKDPANPVLDVGGVGDWDWLGIYSPDVVKIGDSYNLWYSGETLPQAWQTGYAESTDGSNWTRKGMLIPEGPPGTFDTNSADHPAVLIDGSSYRVWYAGIDDSGSYTIGHAEAELCTGSTHTLYLPLVMRDYSTPPPCPPDYLDDFSDPGSGWFIDDDSARKYDYIGGEYQIWVKNANSGWLVTPGGKATDFTVAVSARRMSGTDGPYGIVFGISDDWSEYYDVLIDDDDYSIWRYSSGWVMLQDWTYSGDINTGTAWNRLKVIREGSNISVYINDTFQTTVSDSALLGWRRIGLQAASPPSIPMDFRFDDFALYPASCGPIAADLTGIEWGEAEAHQGIVLPKPETPE